jgi:primosomal protein N' (replication factor Y)
VQALDYSVPEGLHARLQAGHLVIVPFGNRPVQGVVLELIDQPAVQETKAIVQRVDAEPALTAPQLSLAKWLASETLQPIGALIGLFLPPGLSQQADTLYATREVPQSGVVAEGMGKIGSRLLELLRDRGPMRGRQLDRMLPRVEWRRTAQALVRRGVLSGTSVLPPASVRPKHIRTAALGATPQAAARAMESLGSTEATRGRRGKALEYLSRRPGAVNVSWVYAESGCNLADLQELAERELIVLREQEVWRDPLGEAAMNPPEEIEAQPAAVPALTVEQQEAWEVIRHGLSAAGEGRPIVPFLLQGVTGSGKTELYLRACMEVVGAGRQAVILVPEIALTPQTVQRFLTHFPGQVGLIHSRLSDGERYDTWRRARAGSVQVVIGPRSALFSPLPRVGLIVLDECHDSSYHQAEPPFYDAAAAAQAYARMCGAACIMGSATPSVAQRHRSDIGELVRLELRQRVAAASQVSPSPALDLPSVEVVDMRVELKQGNRGIFSGELNAGIAQVLDRGEQAILFLNRRGSATHVFCRNCGYVARCPRCETPLTFHVTAGERLLCHRCGYTRQIPKTCPECGSRDIRAYGLGTEKVEAAVLGAFPKARTLRWDWESTRRKEAHELILHHFASGQADILIGTQMLAKGLDLPRVTLVGIVMADVGLFLPDPFAAERVFQLLTQVAGRAGRSTLGGRVILQTFAPEHYVIQSARGHDVDGFHAIELDQRRRLGFPPFTRLVRLEYRHHDAVKAEEEARALAASLKRRMEASPMAAGGMIGPAPCFFSKVDGKYRWQLILRGADPSPFLAGQRLSEWRVEADPTSLL